MDARHVTQPDETYILHVRPSEQDAVIEDVRTHERIHVPELRELGAVIVRRLERRARLARQGDRKRGTG
jgi:hypothetical protein